MIVAGVVVAITGSTWIDPAISLAITALVLVATVSLVRDATSVLLERAPRDVDTTAIQAAICATPDVEAVHHLHVWSLGSERAALSAHVVLVGDPSLHDAQIVGNRIHDLVNEQFGIGHATIELECHDCDDAVHHTEPPTETHHH